MATNNSKEQGIKLFGTTIKLHGRQLSQEEDRDEENGGDDKTADSKRPDKIIPCPRCKSMDTKFCYFNNYNVNQPRHFCKGCQRYWTAGGALRNVPVGAGRRKSKPAGPGRGFGGGFNSEGCLYDGGSGEVHQIELMDGMVVEEWMQVAASGGFPHGLPVKRPRQSNSVGQPC